MVVGVGGTTVEQESRILGSERFQKFSTAVDTAASGHALCTGEGIGQDEEADGDEG